MIMVSEFKYSAGKINRGYNDRTLYIDLSNRSISEKPVTKEMKEKFTGGRGFDLWLLWQALPRNRPARWDDSENEICIASGPLSGIPVYPGSGKSIVVSISPLTGTVIDSNVGGYFGPYLKFAGWDALEIQGKASSEAVILIDGDQRRVSIEDGSDLPDETHLLVDTLTQRLGGTPPRRCL
jgi:aldehyde:ferredoxin oxidoreductase